MEDKNKPQNNQISLVAKFKERMNEIEQKTGIKGYIVVIFLIISVFLVYLNIFDTVITNLIGTLYPAFWTIKSIEKGNLEEEKHWLTYWAVFGFFIVIDMFNPIISKVLPFYFILKIFFLIFMFIPGLGVCNIIYNFIYSHILIKYESIFEEFAENFEEKEFKFNEKPKPKRLNINKNNLKKNDEVNMDAPAKAGEEINDDDKKEEIKEN